MITSHTIRWAGPAPRSTKNSMATEIISTGALASIQTR
jgi:hypothetical protein